MLVLGTDTNIKAINLPQAKIGPTEKPNAKFPEKKIQTSADSR